MRIVRLAVTPLLVLSLTGIAYADLRVEGDGFKISVPTGFIRLKTEDCFT